MNSVKNLFVVVMLMGVSYGAYQVISAPEPIDYADQEIEELDIQIGPRMDEPGLSNANITADDPNPFPEAPKLPPMTGDSASNAPPLNPPELKVPELTMPQLKMPETSEMRDPVAFTNRSPESDNNFETPKSDFAPPSSAQINSNSSMTPPPLAANPNNVTNSPAQRIQNSFAQNSGAQTSPPQNTPAQNLVAQGGGSFNPQPETRLTPVTPKPETAAPAESLNQFVAGAQDSMSNTLDQAAEQLTSIPNMAGQSTNQVAEAVRSNFENNVVQPVRDVNDMLIQTKDGMASKANGLLEGAQSATSNMVDSMANDVTGALAIPGATAPATATAKIDWQGINQLARGGQVRSALQQLSTYYDAPLTQDQRLKMLNWLDLLAGKVIYSTENLLSANPYVVQSNDTMESIASAWNVPAQLIYNVNQSKIADPSALVPGTELKMIDGPFNAVVNVERQELTLFLQGMYAGRFPVELGQDGPGIEHGSFIVEQKLPGKEYSGQDGQAIAAATPENPYGKYWIGLNGNMSIHESNPASNQQDNRGSIRLSSRDAADVFGILSNGSQVTINR